ncbi:MAG: type II toxin-antitoxin system VapB family antitoxin [Thermoanaerobaculia bacterium]
MKRTNVVLDEKLLEEARKATGERTYSAAINTALNELVRVRRLEAELSRLHGKASEILAPGFLDEYDATHDIDYSLLPKRPKATARVSASRRSLPKKSVKRRGSR